MGKDIVVVAAAALFFFTCCDVIALLYRVVGEVEGPRVVSSHFKERDDEGEDKNK
jgi:hypothetical protein